ncbi:MAG: GFA family protein [Myxococcales bacterium]|nr:GFA family protein [Myxococcales bacterium]
MTPEPLRGRCHCGDVRFTVSDGVGALACHCDDCRKSHDNDMAFLAAPAASVKVEGAEHLTWYDSSEHARRGFCRWCGGRLFKAIGERWMVALGAIEGPTGLRFVQPLRVESKGDGYDVPEVEGAR